MNQPLHPGSSYPCIVLHINEKGQILDIFSQMPLNIDLQSFAHLENIFPTYDEVSFADLLEQDSFVLETSIPGMKKSHVIPMKSSLTTEKSYTLILFPELSLSHELLDIYRSILQTLTHHHPGKSLENALTLLSQHTPVESATLWWGDPSAGYLQVFHHWAIPECKPIYQAAMNELYGVPMQRFLGVDGTLEHIIETKTTIYIPDVRESKEWGSDVLARYGIFSIVEIPLVIRDDFVAILGLDSRPSHAFSEEHIDLFETLAGALAPVVEHFCLRILQQTHIKEKDEFYSELVDIIRRLNAQTTLQGAVHTILDFILERFPITLTAALIPNAEGLRLYIHHKTPISNEIPEALKQIALDDNRRILGRGTTYPALQIVRRVFRQFELDRPQLEHIHSLFRHPLTFGLEIIGIIYAVLDENEPQPQKTLSTLSMFIDLAAQTLFRLRTVEKQKMEYLQAIFETFPDGILLLDKDSRPIFINEPARSLLERFHIEPDRLKDAIFGDYTLHEIIAKLKDQPEYQWEIILNEPEDMALDVIAKSLYIAQNQHCYLFRFCNRTEERRRKEAETTASRMAALGQLAAGIAHDISNFLNGILGELQLIELKSELPHDIRESINRAIDLGFKAGEITHQILDFARQTPSEELKPLEIISFLKESAKVLAHTLPESIQIHLDYPANRSFWIKADPAALQQIILNLALNARDATPEGGMLFIRIRPPEQLPSAARSLELKEKQSFIVLEVEDTGVGIPPEILNRIFEPFFTTKPKGKGTGLGLSQVYGLVKRLGGDITVRSVVNRGTTFYIGFPLYEIIEESPDASKLQSLPRGRGTTVLLIEDNPVVLDILTQMLKHLDYQVIRAQTATDAYYILQNEKREIDLILTDLVLPDERGLSHCHRLQALAPNSALVLITGYPPDDITYEFVNSHRIPVLLKPTTIERLAETLRRALESKNPSS